MDFLGNNSQIVSVKPTPPILGIRCNFTLEAIICPRSFSTYAPIITKTDSAFRCGFGLVRLPPPPPPTRFAALRSHPTPRSTPRPTP